MDYNLIGPSAEAVAQLAIQDMLDIVAASLRGDYVSIYAFGTDIEDISFMSEEELAENDQWDDYQPAKEWVDVFPEPVVFGLPQCTKSTKEDKLCLELMRDFPQIGIICGRMGGVKFIIFSAGGNIIATEITDNPREEMKELRETMEYLSRKKKK